jgi:hypothetical protein
MKKFATFAIVGLLIYSCGQTKKQEETNETKTISELVSEPLGFDGTQVVFEGVITHICKHSGDKMRINQVDDTDYSIMVMLEDFQPEFNPEFEGKHVRINGILKTQVLNMNEAEVTHDHAHAHDGEEGHECASTEEAVKALEEKGITPDVRAYIELKSYEIIEVAEDETLETEEETVEVAETPSQV